MAITKIRQSMVKDLERDLNLIREQIRTFKQPVALLENLPLTDNNDGDMRVCLEDGNIYIWNEADSEWRMSSGKGGSFAKVLTIPIKNDAQTTVNTGIRFDGVGDLQTSSTIINIYLNGLLQNANCFTAENINEELVITWTNSDQLYAGDELSIQYYDTLGGKSGSSIGSSKVDLSNISSNILPNESHSIDIGSEDKPFKSIYANEMFKVSEQGNLETIASQSWVNEKMKDEKYIHPKNHSASIILQDENNRFVTDTEKAAWNDKETVFGAQTKADKALSDSKIYTDTKVAGILNAAPEALDTLNELASALGNDPNFSTTVMAEIGKKVNKETGKGLSTNDYTTQDKSKLDKIASEATKTVNSSINGNINVNGTEQVVYSHPIGDGNLHIPATGTTNGGKVLTAGSTGGSLSWTSLPTSLPASDVYPWAKSPYKPTYTCSELRASSATNLLNGSGLCSLEMYGTTNKATGAYSFAEGVSCKAQGVGSHAEGGYNVAIGDYSHTSGFGTTAETSTLYSIGWYNKKSTGQLTGFSASNNAFIIGNGTASTTRSNAFRVNYSGQTYALSAFNSSGADYAEYFEWEDGNINNEDRIGMFVTLNGDKIQLANSQSDYILGVVSGNASIIGNSYEDAWNEMYERDDFGRLLYEYVDVEVKKVIGIDEDGNDITSIENVKEKRIKLNPNYDPNKEYIPRSERKEWSTIGMLGQLIVKDDGTCKVNSYCKVNDDGIATLSNDDNGYRVIKRINESIIKILKQ